MSVDYGLMIFHRYQRLDAVAASLGRKYLEVFDLDIAFDWQKAHESNSEADTEILTKYIWNKGGEK